MLIRCRHPVGPMLALIIPSAGLAASPSTPSACVVLARHAGSACRWAWPKHFNRMVSPAATRLGWDIERSPKNNPTYRAVTSCRAKLIFGPVFDHGFYLRRRDVDSVADGRVRGAYSAGSYEFRRAALRRVATVRLSEHLSGPAFAERSGESVAELLVVGLETAGAHRCRLKTAQQ